MMPTWGTAADVQQLEGLFDKMKGFTTRHDLPAFIGEFGVTNKKESASRIRWMSAVASAAHSRRMVPALWDTGHEISRHEPHDPSPELVAMLASLEPAASAPAPNPASAGRASAGAVALRWRLDGGTDRELCPPLRNRLDRLDGIPTTGPYRVIVSGQPLPTDREGRFSKTLDVRLSVEDDCH
jgi:hypothetical protein